MQVLGAWLIVMAVALAAYGWGRPTVRWAYGDTRAYPAFTAVVGVATLTALGGLLNLLHIAHAPVLGAVLVVGWGLAAMALRRHRAGPDETLRATSGDIGEHIVRIALLALAAFFAATLMPSQAFNFYDDFHTYFSRPLRMLATGSVGGDEFELLGADSLGGQAWWHGVFIFTTDPGWLNGFDAVFCFLLGGLLLIDLRRRLGAPSAYLIAAVVAYVAINPQAVNISALFSGVAISLGIAFAALPLGPHAARRAVPLGLLLAALVALKMTFVILAGAFAVVYFGLLVWRNGAPALKSAALTAAVAGLALLPWLAMHARHYLAMRASAPDDSVAGAPGPLDGWRHLLSIEPLLYGGYPAAYGAMIALVGVGGAVALRAYRRNGNDQTAALCATIAAMGAGTLAIALASFSFIDPEPALRYVCPALIAVIPLLLLSASRLPSASIAIGGIGAGAWGAAAIAAMIGVLFGDSVALRVARAYTSHTLISFPFNANYLQYNRLALGDAGSFRTRAAQERVPPGQPLVAWISTPFQLDFARNPVRVASEPGWINRWLDLPLGAPPEALRAYFLARGVRHLVWEPDAPGIAENRDPGAVSAYPVARRLARVNRYMRGSWQRLVQSSQVLHRADGIVVIDLGAPISTAFQRSLDGKG